VRGEIRTTVEYLPQLLETKEFIENTIDTSWLDGIIKERLVKIDVPPHLVVVSAAVHRAFQHVRDSTEALKESFRKGQVSVAGIPAINTFDVEVAYQDMKYPFHVQRIAADVYRFRLGSNVIDARVSLAADGALLATFGGETHRIFGMDEPLGLRLVVDGNTILMYVEEFRKLYSC
jgi:acetyl-CoA carboxylase/biotin carboxylase 1